MPSNNRNAQNKILAQKAKALREKDGAPKKDITAELSVKAQANRSQQQASNDRKHRLKQVKAKKIKAAGGKTKYEAIVFERLLSDFSNNGMKNCNRKRKRKSPVS
jgi:hypothetical protein